MIETALELAGVTLIAAAVAAAVAGLVEYVSLRRRGARDASASAPGQDADTRRDRRS